MNREIKQTILDAVIRVLETELERQAQANAQSNAATTFSASNADKQRDTTGYEAAYLARGYAQHALTVRNHIDQLKMMEAEDFTGQEIDIGALVEVEMDGAADWYLLLSGGGGTEVSVDGQTVTVITPESPLGQELMGNIEAGFVRLPSGAEGIILSVS